MRDEETYGQRSPDFDDIKALAELVTAMGRLRSDAWPDKFMDRVSSVLEVYAEQFRGCAD